MAVIGGLVRIEGAWLGAFTFIIIDNYVRDFQVPLLGMGGTLFGGSFNTLIGIIFLAIVLVSPDGLLGIWERLFRSKDRSQERAAGSIETPEPAQ
jgi:branched-chain amino acid transport system permease protein